MNNPMFENLMAHIGHNIEIVTYGMNEPVNVSIECIDCCEVLYSADRCEEE